MTEMMSNDLTDEQTRLELEMDDRERRAELRRCASTFTLFFCMVGTIVLLGLAPWTVGEHFNALDAGRPVEDAASSNASLPSRATSGDDAQEADGGDEKDGNVEDRNVVKV